MTALFEQIIFGPIQSRRLGTSLGVNLLPCHNKICNFDCIYCECGDNHERRGKGSFNPIDDVAEQLEATLQKMSSEGKNLDVITFAGNGEPTLHPQFDQVIELTIELRNRYFPTAKVSVLSNGTTLDKPKVVEALAKIDNAILKIDSAIETTLRTMNRPNGTYDLAKTIAQMAALDGNMILQTMFLRGNAIDNTTPQEVEAWIEMVKQIAPLEVMIYSIDRDTPTQGLEKVSSQELAKIGERVHKLGIKCSWT